MTKRKSPTPAWERLKILFLVDLAYAKGLLDDAPPGSPAHSYWRGKAEAYARALKLAEVVSGRERRDTP